MADSFKNLGQLAPAAATLSTLYTVPTSTSATVSSISICNRTNLSSSFRISHALAGAADSTVQYLYYDQPIPANCTFVATIGLTMATTDILRVQSANGNLTFQAWGVEIT